MIAYSPRAGGKLISEQSREGLLASGPNFICSQSMSIGVSAAARCVSEFGTELTSCDVRVWSAAGGATECLL